MTDVEIVNPVPFDAGPAWYTALTSALLGNPYEPDFAGRIERWQPEWQPDRSWGVRDRGRWVGTLATLPRTLTIPGVAGGTSKIAVDALSAVSVAATHRRRGLLTRMLGASLRAAKDRGDAASILVAAEWPIYGRFGYAPATSQAHYTYRPRRRGAAVTASPAGIVRQVEPAELCVHAPDIFDRSRRLRPGQIDRPGKWWARLLSVGYEPIGDRYHWFLHEGPDGPDGLLGWRVTRDFDTDGSMGAIAVTNLVTASDLAYRNLWAYLSGIDVIEEISLPNRPVDEPVRWLLSDGRALCQTYAGDFLWLSLLDVPAALSARGYATPGRLVLDVVDDTRAGYARGRFRLDASPDGAECTPTTERADLQLPARALAAAYLGASSIESVRRAGGVDELTSGAVQRLDTMLGRSIAPWCQTTF